MSHQQPNNPLHGVTLKTIVEELQLRHGWEGLAERINVRCFRFDPSLKSSLKFLRKTPWARAEVEQLYLADQRKRERKLQRKQAKAEKRENAQLEEVFEEDASTQDSADPPA